MSEEKKSKPRVRKSTAKSESKVVGAKAEDGARRKTRTKKETSEAKVTVNRHGRTYPVLPLRNIVVFPNMIVPLFVGRNKSVNALEALDNEHNEILLVAQKDIAQDDPQSEDIYRVGTVANILQLLKLPDGTVKVLVEGVKRVRLTRLHDKEEYFVAETEDLEDRYTGPKSDLTGLARSVASRFEDYAALNKKIAPEILASISQLEDPSQQADTIASHLNLKIAEKQALLETSSVEDRLEMVFASMEAEIDILEVEKRIRGRVKKQMEKTQREYYLNEQIKAIQKELGDGDEGGDELSELEEKIKQTRLSKEARDKAYSELKKLKSMSPSSAESSVVRNYLEWLVELPWDKHSKITKSLEKAEAILDNDHYGLEKVKERILEYLAVQSRSRKLKGPILCLVGPPGVGKTSLARSIAHATGRKYVRMALGGMRDESEIRGHRRTYIGAMPGKILQSMKKVGVSNPLFLLDEVDKLGSDWRGDPSSALLEVLDPEQNKSFNDHYLEVDYDLSDVMFVATANTLDMPQPLLDRMEVIRLSGYTEEEKLEIAKRHLIKKQTEEHNLKPTEWEVTDDALVMLIRRYTREAGVRDLERFIARLARKTVREILTTKAKHVTITAKSLEKYAGIPRFHHGEIDPDDQVGIVTGLAWTQVGGEILTIESLLIPGKGQIKQTGKLGDVMKESVSAAFSYVRSRADDFGISDDVLEKKDVHVHLPEGAVPKDGPSAGIALVTSLVSVMTRIPVKHDVAMTGEVTLRGHVLEIGGLKEKLLAALRAGIKTVMIPEANMKDLPDIPERVRQELKILPVRHVDEVLDIALVRKPEPILTETLLNKAVESGETVLSQPLQH
ncbi:endopeptidase La [Acetobacteraceae bacterium ESL0709]|nr:endopeptidase La [Acetobacteraceae bacterium ESL0697]MDF7678311.1 endopeptidase La [Acetobacteraceae bacterium ESL0709]